MYYIPTNFLDYLQAESPQIVINNPTLWANENDCHNNCILSGYPRVLGYYFLKHDNKIYAIQHSVVNKDGLLIDITPNKYFKDKIYFSKCNNISDYIDYPIVYYDNFVLLNIFMNVQKNNYYIYALVDPRTGQPFYIGKGTKNRWKSHLKETEETTENWHKFCIINDIKNNGYSVIVDFLVKDILDEQMAYDLEALYIKKYGRICDGGILTNVCLDNRPPNHRGKSYYEIYGENADYQLEKRYRLQVDNGGWFRGHKHKNESKLKIGLSVRRNAEKRLSEDAILEFGKKFCEFFDNKISPKKWKYFTKIHFFPSNIRKSFRFGGKDIFEVYKEKYNAEIVNDSLLWFYNPKTKERIRCFDWEYSMGVVSIPLGFVRGRGNF